MWGQFDQLEETMELAERPSLPMRALKGVGSALRKRFYTNPKAASVADVAKEATADMRASQPFFGVTTGATADGANHWYYGVTEVEKTVAGYGGTTNWTTLANGRTVTARNWYEENPQVLENTPAELQNQEIKAIGDDTIVLVWPVKLRTGSGVTLEYWFHEVNDFDAECA